MLFGAGFSWRKLAVDQLVAFPAFLAALLAANETLKILGSLPNRQSDEGVSALLLHAASVARNKLQADWLTTYQAGLLIWPAAQFINFRHVAPELRLLFMNSVSLGWGVYLSSQGQKQVTSR